MNERVRRHAEHRDTTAAPRLSCLPLRIQRIVPPVRRDLPGAIAIKITARLNLTFAEFCAKPSARYPGATLTIRIRDNTPLNDRNRT